MKSLAIVATIAALGAVHCVPAGALAQADSGGSGAASKSQPFRVITTFKVGGEGGWDYLIVDPDTERLFVPRGTHVMVLKTDDGAQVGDIPDTAGVHGVALAPALNKGFTSNGRANTVTVFDLNTLKVLGTVPTGTNPDAIAFEPSTKRVLAFNGRSKDATVINAEDQTVVATIPLGGKPEFAAVDGHGKVYVNIEDTSEIVRIDAPTSKVEERWSLAPGSEPSGLAIDPARHRLFSVCANEMMAVVDCASGKVLATPKIGKGVDGAAFDAAGGYALSSNGDGTLTVVGTNGENPFTVVQTLQTTPRARTLAIDPKTRRIYLPTAEFEAAKEGERRPAMKPGTFKIVVVGP